MVMTGTPSLDKLGDDARKRAGTLLADQEFRSLPVKLNQLAKRHKVSGLRFMEILGSAGLIRTGNEYDIVINTDARGLKQTDTAPLSVDSDWSSLAPSLRFTIAHEIAHALVLDLAGGNPNKDLFFRHEEAIDHLCNELASRFLMPATQSIAVIGSGLFDAEHLYNVAKRIGVSPEALTRRLDSPEFLDAFVNMDGLVSFVRQETGEGTLGNEQMRFVAGKIWGVRALSQFGIGPLTRARDRTPRFPAGRFVEDLKLGLSLADRLQNDVSGTEALTLGWRGGKPNNTLKCEAQFYRTSRSPLCALLTVRVIEGPMKVNG